MKARIKWIEGVSFAGQSESGHTVVMDGPPDSGGKNLGVRPMEMLLLGMGGAGEQRQQPDDCREHAEPDQVGGDGQPPGVGVEPHVLPDDEHPDRGELVERAFEQSAGQREPEGQEPGIRGTPSHHPSGEGVGRAGQVK